MSPKTLVRHYRDLNGELRQVIYLEEGPAGSRYVLDGQWIVTIPDSVLKNGMGFDVWKDVEKHDSWF